MKVVFSEGRVGSGDGGGGRAGGVALPYISIVSKTLGKTD